MKKLLFFFVLYFFTGIFIFSQSNFSRGEELFMQNKPAQALVFLENTIIEDPAHIKAFLYLGIIYEQLDRLDEAIAVYRKILNRDDGLIATLATNIGNAYFRKGNSEYAIDFYSQAIAKDSVYSSAYLGRANARIKTGSLREAIADYEMYLALEPRSPQKAQIERIIAFIRSEFAAEENRRLLAEQNAREEAERRQRLLDDLAASLQSAADNSQGLSAGTENVKAYDNEFELD